MSKRTFSVLMSVFFFGSTTALANEECATADDFFAEEEELSEIAVGEPADHVAVTFEFDTFTARISAGPGVNVFELIPETEESTRDPESFLNCFEELKESNYSRFIC